MTSSLEAKLRKTIQPLVDNAADELVALLSDRLRSSLEVAVSTFASDLDDVQASPLRAPKGKAKKAKGGMAGRAR